MDARRFRSWLSQPAREPPSHSHKSPRRPPQNHGSVGQHHYSPSYFAHRVANMPRRAPPRTTHVQELDQRSIRTIELPSGTADDKENSKGRFKLFGSGRKPTKLYKVVIPAKGLTWEHLQQYLELEFDGGFLRDQSQTVSQEITLSHPALTTGLLPLTLRCASSNSLTRGCGCCELQVGQVLKESYIVILPEKLDPDQSQDIDMLRGDAKEAQMYLEEIRREKDAQRLQPVAEEPGWYQPR